MSARYRLILAVAAAAILAPATAFADVIFDNTAGGDHGSTTTSAAQLGGEATATGTSRTVTELDIAFTDLGSPATADLQAFLYSPDGSGLPATLLWQSAVMSGVSIASDNDVIAFAVPSIVVPDTFDFTAAITNTSGVVGFVPGSGATVGTFDQAFVGGPGPGTWGALSTTFEVQARVIATSPVTSPVPEPATLALFGAGLAGACAMRRRRAVKR